MNKISRKERRRLERKFTKAFDKMSDDERANAWASVMEATARAQEELRTIRRSQEENKK